MRDLAMLQNYAPFFQERHLYVGAYPGCKDGLYQGVQVHFLGKGIKPKNEWSSRAAYIYCANQLLKNPLTGWVGVNLSPYAPLWNAPRQNKSFGILHHFIGPRWREKIPLVGSLINRWEYAYYRRFPRIVTINADSTRLIGELNSQIKVFQSANACDESLFALPDNSSSTEPFVLFFGRLDRFMKGLDLLVNAFAQAWSKNPGYKLLLAGRCDQKQRESLQALLAPFKHLPIEVLENPSEKMRADLLSRCSFFCSPSRFEGWGIAALEACAAGKPALVSKAAGFLDSVGLEAGWHVEVENPGALYCALNSLMQNPALVQNKKHTAREWARRFTWVNIFAIEQQWLQGELGNQDG